MATVSIGNSTVNVVANSTFLKVGNSTVNNVITPTSVTMGNSTVNTSINSVSFNVGGVPIGTPGFIWGLTLTNNVSDATNDIDIAAGSCRGGSDTDNLVLAASLTKRLDASWAVGTNQGGLDTGAIANTTYHVWLIKRPDTGVVDALFSASATSPTMPSNYTLKRRIGSIIRVSSAILAFSQYGDYFQLTTPVRDAYHTTSPPTTATLLTLSVPTGIKVKASMYAYMAGSQVILYVNSPDQTASTPSWQSFSTAGSGFNSGDSYTNLDEWTNTSSQVRYWATVAVSSAEMSIVTKGWTDLRGRDF